MNLNYLSNCVPIYLMFKFFYSFREYQLWTIDDQELLFAKREK